MQHATCKAIQGGGGVQEGMMKSSKKVIGDEEVSPGALESVIFHRALRFPLVCSMCLTP